MLKHANEQVFLISDYIWNVIRRWKAGICLMAACAILLGGVSYYMDYKDYRREVAESKKEKKKKDNNDSAIESQLASLSESERLMVESANRQVDNVVKQTSYLENAAIMNCDPYNVHKERITFSVTAGSGTTMICRKYTELIFSDDAVEKILEASNGTMKRSDLSEMLTTSITNAGETSSAGEEEGSTVSEKSMMLVVNVRALDRETAESMGAVVEQTIIDSYDEVVKTMGAHTLNKLNSYYRGGRETSIVNAQNDANKELYTYNKRIKDLMLTMTDKQKRIVNQYMSLKLYGKEVEEASAKLSKPKPDIKRILLGMILGALIYLALELARWQFGGKINSKDELSRNMDLPILGVVDGPKKGFFVDAWIDKIRRRNELRPDGEEAYDMLLSGIAAEAEQKDTKNVLLTGSTRLNDSLKETMEKLAADLTAKGIDAKLSDCMLTSVKTANEAADRGAVVIVENIGRSSYQNVMNECSLCAMRGIDLLGVVLAE